MLPACSDNLLKAVSLFPHAAAYVMSSFLLCFHCWQGVHIALDCEENKNEDLTALLTGKNKYAFSVPCLAGGKYTH